MGGDSGSFGDGFADKVSDELDGLNHGENAGAQHEAGRVANIAEERYDVVGNNFVRLLVRLVLP